MKSILFLIIFYSCGNESNIDEEARINSPLYNYEESRMDSSCPIEITNPIPDFNFSGLTSIYLLNDFFLKDKTITIEYLNMGHDPKRTWCYKDEGLKFSYKLGEDNDKDYFFNDGSLKISFKNYCSRKSDQCLTYEAIFMATSPERSKGLSYHFAFKKHPMFSYRFTLDDQKSEPYQIEVWGQFKRSSRQHYKPIYSYGISLLNDKSLRPVQLLLQNLNITLELDLPKKINNETMYYYEMVEDIQSQDYINFKVRAFSESKKPYFLKIETDIRVEDLYL